MTLFINGVLFHTPLEATITSMVAKRPFAQSAQHNIIARHLATAAATLIDHHHSRGTPGPTNPLAHVWQEGQDALRQAAKEGTRTPGLDVDFTWTLYAHGPHTLGLFIGHDASGCRDLFLEERDRCWSWGRYEPDASISAQEWNQREEDWTGALGGDAHWVPAHRGVSLSFPRPISAPSPEMVLTKLPTPSARAKRLARDQVSLIAGQRAHEAGEDVMRAILRAHDDPQVAILTETLLPTLPTITLDTLLGAPR